MNDLPFFSRGPAEDGATGLQGPKGEDGKDGKDGKDGATPTIEISDDGYWVINKEKTNVKAKGTDGKNGKDGANGESATHSWNGTTLTVTSASGVSSADLKGDKGDKGDTGEKGADGQPGKDGANGKSAYEYAQDGGYSGTEEAFMQLLANIMSIDLAIDETDSRLYLTINGTRTGTGVAIQLPKEDPTE